MKVDPVTVLWHLLRNNETDGNFLSFKFTWIVKPDNKIVQWTGTNVHDEKLMDLYMRYDAPTAVEVVDSRKDIPPTYRCNICGGLVQFDDTPPNVK